MQTHEHSTNETTSCINVQPKSGNDTRDTSTHKIKTASGTPKTLPSEIQDVHGFDVVGEDDTVAVLPSNGVAVSEVIVCGVAHNILLEEEGENITTAQTFLKTQCGVCMAYSTQSDNPHVVDQIASLDGSNPTSGSNKIDPQPVKLVGVPQPIYDGEGVFQASTVKTSHIKPINDNALHRGLANTAADTLNRIDNTGTTTPGVANQNKYADNAKTIIEDIRNMV